MKPFEVGERVAVRWNGRQIARGAIEDLRREFADGEFYAVVRNEDNIPIAVPHECLRRLIKRGSRVKVPEKSECKCSSR